MQLPADRACFHIPDQKLPTEPAVVLALLSTSVGGFNFNFFKLIKSVINYEQIMQIYVLEITELKSCGPKLHCIEIAFCLQFSFGTLFCLIS